MIQAGSKKVITGLMVISKEVVVRYFSWSICILIVIALVVPAHALVLRRSESVEIAADEIIDDDLIAFAGDVDVKGTVTGNVCAFAQTVNVSGDIGGSLFIGAASASINARSVQTVWAMGGNLSVSGNVTRNVILAGGSLDVDADARIGKDLAAYGGKFNVHGEIDGAVKGGVGSFVMAGKSGSVKIKADKTKIKSTAVILGDFDLTSKSAPEIDEGATIAGEMSVREIEPDEAKPFFFALAPLVAFLFAVAKAVVLIGKIIVGILLVALCKKYVRRVMDTLVTETWKSLGWGFLGVIVIPVAAVVLFATLIGYPLGILAVYAYSIVLYLSSIFVAVVIGEKLIQLFKNNGEV
jgi:cytoskeletal protein CcmA (bactofilin family)